MNAAAHLPYQPHDNSGGIRSFIFAVVMHVLLFSFLYFGINWSTSQPPAAAMADLWTGLPANTTPPPPPPPRVEPQPEPPKVEKPVIEEPPKAEPPPVKPDIEVQTKKPEPKKKPLPPKEEPKKEVAKKDPPPKKKEEPKKEEIKPPPMDDIQKELAKEMQKNQAAQISRQAQRESQQMAAAGAQGSSDAWASKVAALVRSKVPINIASAVSGNPTAEFDVTLIPSSRDVISVKLVKSSGNAAYDEAAAQAIQASSPLPPLTPGMAPLSRVLRFEATPKPK